jgi:hypothetical protein
MTSSLSDLVGQPLTWVLAKRGFTLIAPDNSAIATLESSGPHLKKAKALVPSGTLFPDGTIFLRQEEDREGIRPVVFVVISAVEQGPPLASYKRDWPWHTGKLSFPDERGCRWDNVTLGGRKKVWRDTPPGPTTYVQFSGGFGKYHVEINPLAAEIPELSLLLVLGLYNILVENLDSVKELKDTLPSPLGIIRHLFGW